MLRQVDISVSSRTRESMRAIIGFNRSRSELTSGERQSAELKKRACRRNRVSLDDVPRMTCRD